MNEVDKLLLADLAREAIESRFKGEEPSVEVVRHLNQKCKVFLALRKNNALRGGVGLLEDKPLYQAVIETARKAAFEDPRFHPLKPDEARFLKVEISIIRNVKKLLATPDEYAKLVEIGRHGLILEGEGRALLLPSVAVRKGYTAVQFLNALAQTAGLPFHAWRKPENKVYTFEAETFSG